MDPSTLPVELFIDILQYLPPLYVWQLRRTAKSWCNVLSSSVAVATALRGMDLESFKRAHLSKPVSCVDLTKDDLYHKRFFAFHGKHIAYMARCQSRSGFGYDCVLYIHNIETEELYKHSLQTEAEPSDIYIGDVAIFIAGHELYIFTFDGRKAIRPLPGKYRGGIVATYKDKVAILRSWEDHRPESLINANTLWVYDHPLDKWTSQSVPETCIVSHWRQCLLVEDTVHIVSVGPDVCQSEDAFRHQPKYILHVRSGKRQWTHRYTLTQSHQYSSIWRGYCMLQRAGFDFGYDVTWTNDQAHSYHCMLQRAGVDYDVTVTDDRAHTHHCIRMTPDKFVSLGATGSVRWHETTFTVVPGGIETPAGYLWNTSMPKGAQTPTLLLVNADYLVSLFDEQHMGITHVCVLKFKGPRSSLSPLFVWEDADDADRAQQIVRRANLDQQDPPLRQPQTPYTQEQLDAFRPGLVG